MLANCLNYSGKERGEKVEEKRLGKRGEEKIG